MLRIHVKIAALALGLVACIDDAVSPVERADEPPAGSRALGVVEVTISGLGTGQVSSMALSAPDVPQLERLRAQRDAAVGTAGAPGSLAPQTFSLPGGEGTMQLELVSTGSFTEGKRGAGGVLYIYATYLVRNAGADGTPYAVPRSNLTFFAVDTNETFGQTAISELVRFDGTDADQAIAASLIPTGAATRDLSTARVASAGPDVLQVITEAEAEAILGLAPEGVTDVFPYGFVVRRVGSTTTRELPANPGADQFDGVVTFAYKVPLQATRSDDPFTVSLMFLVVDDDEVKITQSIEEQGSTGQAGFDARAAALGADVRTLLPPGPVMVATEPGTVRMLCNVRAAGGIGSPLATIDNGSRTDPWVTAPSLEPGFQTVPRTWRPGAASCENLPPADATSFAVHGFMSGRNAVDAYDQHSSFVQAPAPPRSQFFPGEEIEVTLTMELGGSKPTVARYRAAVSGGSGVFEERAIMDHGRLFEWPLTLGDVTGDGVLDIVMPAYTTSVFVFVKFVDWYFDAHDAVDTGSYATAVALGDLDGDGDLDAVATKHRTNEAWALLNHGGGDFDADTAYAVGIDPTAVALGDLDGDGDLDAVTANTGSDDISLLLNLGNGKFAAPTTYSTGPDSEPIAVALGDIDGDGDLDVVTAGKNAAVLRNNGNGTFSAHATLAAAAGSRSVALGDLDGDGDLDLVAAITAGYHVSMLSNDGNGTFGSFTAIPTDGGPVHVVLGDLDGDGDLDMVTANALLVSYSTLRNQGNGTFADAQAHVLTMEPQSIGLGDLDGDGDLDMVISGWNGMYVFENL